MNSENLDRGINSIDDALIEEAAKPFESCERTKKYTFKKVLPELAACVAVFITAGIIVKTFISPAVKTGSEENTTVQAQCTQNENQEIFSDKAQAPGASPSLYTETITEAANEGTQGTGLLIINEINPAQVNSDIYAADLRQSDFVPVEATSLDGFYSLALSKLPLSFATEKSVQPCGYYKNDDGIYYSVNTLVFSGEKKQLSIALSLGIYAYEGILTASEDELSLTASSVSGTDATLAHYCDKNGQDCYIARFALSGTCADIRTVGLSQSEFMNIVYTLLRA